MTATGSVLSPQHLALISASAIADEVRDARGYRTVRDGMELHEEGYAGYQCKAPGLLLPVHTVSGSVDGSFYRPDDPRRDATDRIIKYEAPAGQRMHLDVPPAVFPRIGHPTEPLAITEGARKADAAVSHGLDCISIGGVWSWRGKNLLDGLTALGDWENVHTRGRTFYLIFDSDAIEKRGVNQALNRLRRFLDSRNARVRICYLPQGDGSAKMGLDDYLAAGGSIERILADATVDLVITPFQIAVNGNGAVTQSLPVELDPDRAHLTDLGNAMRLVARHGQDLRYVHDWKEWLVWDGRRWERDKGYHVQDRATETIRNLYREAAEELDVRRRAEILEHAKRSEGTGRFAAMLVQAHDLPGVPIEVEDLDRDPWLLNCENGTLDLRTGELLSNQRANLITKVSPVRFDPLGFAPRWLAFLERIVPDPDIREFLQRAVGYSLTGLVSEQVLFLLYGTGMNGKSTFIDVLQWLLGDYAEGTNFETFLAKNNDLVRNDLADLTGARFVSAVEANPGSRFSESVVKQVTGGDVTKVRRLYGNFFAFRPVFKLWLAANHRPVVRGTDHAIWRRMRLIPFEVQIPAEEDDKELKAKLIAEAPGILSWALEGCLAWQAAGLQAPKGVVQATADYREEMDVLGTFLSDCCALATTAAVGSGALYEAYCRYTADQHGEPLSQTAFGRSLTERGIREDRRSGTRHRIGIGLRATEYDEETGEP